MLEQSHRRKTGGRIDRTKPIAFEFDGRRYWGYAGDTLASALVANGVRVVGRSFKYHRPRGLFAAGVEEPNALVQLRTGQSSRPNIRATEIELTEGLSARAVNCWPSARFDVAGLNDIFARFLPAGFYYKTFIWPAWKAYEWAVRRAAGLGRAPLEPAGERYETRFAHCDVLVVGAGPAGLAAAHAASGAGARVILCEQGAALGGRLLWDPALVDGEPSERWIEKIDRALAITPDVKVLTRTTAVGYFDHNSVALVERRGCYNRPETFETLWQVRAGRVVIATGATERPLVFPGNDRPGVMLATAALRYLQQYAAVAGRRVAVFTNNDDAYACASAFADEGWTTAVIDVRSNPPPYLVNDLESRGVSVIAGAEIISTRGASSLTEVTVRGKHGDKFQLGCDLLAVSGGFDPALQLYCQSGGRPVFDATLQSFVPGPSVQRETSVGAASGVLEMAAAISQAHDAGIAASAEAGFPHDRPPTPPVTQGRPSPAIQPHLQVGGRGKAFIDLQNDVTVDDIRLAVRENFTSVEHVKRYTTVGMATDQGKTSGANAIGVLAALTGQNAAEVGVTRHRFPATPIDIAALAGRYRQDLFRPIRRLPAHDWHALHGAKFEDYGGWLRPAFYPRQGESESEAILREARQVRLTAGLFDGSPLGKIEVLGTDAAEFLDLVYATPVSSLKSGRIRYGLMLNEYGAIIDDGVITRLAEDHFIVGTTGAGAFRIAEWLEEWRQCEWPQLDVVCHPVTTAWAVLTLSGPRAREILEAAGTDISCTAGDFPHLAYREGHIAGTPARLSRVSFTGEVSFEISVHASQAGALFERLLATGAPLGLALVGVEAWMTLRIEKGYIHIGADTDGATVPADIGWPQVKNREPHFIGKRSLFLDENVRPDRFHLVGLEPLASAAPLPVGAQLWKSDQGLEDTSQGYITSSAFSPTLGRGVALAMVRAGRERHGQVLTIRDDSRHPRLARITAPGAFDRDGERLRG